MIFMRKYIVIIILLFTCYRGLSQGYPNTDSLRTYNIKFITNNAATAFTNLRLHTLLRGIIDWIDTARAGTGGGGALGIDTLYALNDTTIRYRRNGVFRNAILKGIYDYRRKVDTAYALNDSTLQIKINGTNRNIILPGRHWNLQGVLSNGSTLDSNFTVTLADSLKFTSGFVIIDSLRLPALTTATDTTSHKPLARDATGRVVVFPHWPGGSAPDSTIFELVNRKTQTLSTPNPYADAVRYPSAAAVIYAGTFTEFPHLYCTGAGTAASPFIHADQTAYLQTILDTFKVARLTDKRYRLEKPVAIRNIAGGIKTARIKGEGGFIHYPNAEGEVLTGTVIKSDTTAFKVGTTDLTNQPRPGRFTIQDLTLWGPGRTLINGLGGNWDGAGVLIDGYADQPQIDRLNISNHVYGVVVKGIMDAGTISNSSIIGNRYPIWIDTTAVAATYTTIRDNIIADNYGPVVIDGAIGDTSSWVKITGNTFASNCFQHLGDLAVIPDCGIWINSSGNIFTNNYVTNSGFSNLNQTRIAADGIIVDGNNNIITDNIISGHPSSGKCGIRIRSGTGNVINCKFSIPLTSYFPNNETDVIIESGAVNTTLFVYPGMTYTDNGTGTVIIDGSGGGLSIPLNEIVIGTGASVTSTPKLKYDGTDLSVGNATGSNRIVLNHGSGQGSAVVGQLSGTDQFEFGFNNNSAFGGTGRTFYGYDPVASSYLFGFNSSHDFFLPKTAKIDIGDGTSTNPIFHLRYPLASGGAATIYRAGGAAMFEQGVNNQAAFGGSAGNANGRTYYIYDSTRSAYVAAFNASGEMIIPQLAGTGVRLTAVDANGKLQAVSSSGISITPLADFFSITNNTGTSETDLQSYTVPTNTLDANGEKITYEVSGLFNDATSTPRIRLYFGGTNIFDSGVLTISATGSWQARVVLTRSSSSLCMATTTFTATNTTSPPVNVTSISSFNFATTNILKSTGTATGAGGGDNDISCYAGSILFVPVAQ